MPDHYVFKGINSNASIHTYKGKVGKYSNWSLMNPVHPLDLAPNQHHIPGTGRHPHDTRLTSVWRGVNFYTSPMEDPGEGKRLAYHRWHPFENKAAGNNQAFPLGFGHADRVTSYSKWDNFVRRGVPGSDPLQTSLVGHPVRAVSTAKTFGSDADFVNKGVPSTTLFPSNFGHGIPAGYRNEYGHNKPLEWIGLPSSKAL